MNVLLWGVLPYVVLALLVGGTVWRYRYDQFGWTTRSSQLYESRLLRIGSPLFHFGLVFVLVGHIVGLVIPKSWTDTLGVSQHIYHVNALVVGGLAGLCTLAGVAILVYRRRTTGPVFMATTPWPRPHGRSTCTSSWRCCCSPCGRSPGLCMRSPRPCTTCSAPTSSTGAGTPGLHRGVPRRVPAGRPLAPKTETAEEPQT